MRRIMTTIALLGLSLFVLLAPTPASAASTVDVTSATLVARGVAVDVTITVACPAGMSGGVELSLRQRSGNGVAYGSGWAPVACTGEPQEVTGRVAAQADGEIFRNGETLVNVGFELCGQEGCEYPQINDTIRVTH
ncbi:hypothetical protein [Micromonospora halophytica]|uniref:Neocarzinostatin family protein n=1 Tax=Micromonospora halophytica TaxID=47864 RepID=A0A1C5I6P3_9ACTN|nr:hypothetical protein [Micromonospora halophytica]SCG53779.1 hypothetical protein GA0070560_10889 [Micromonospora halophytica]